MSSPGQAIADALTAGRADLLLVIAAIAVIVGVLLLWGYVKQSAGSASGSVGRSDDDEVIGVHYEPMRASEDHIEVLNRLNRDETYF